MGLFKSLGAFKNSAAVVTKFQALYLVSLATTQAEIVDFAY